MKATRSAPRPARCRSRRRYPLTALCGLLGAGLAVPALVHGAHAHPAEPTGPVACAPGVPARHTNFDYLHDAPGFPTPDAALAAHGRDAAGLRPVEATARVATYARFDGDRPVLVAVAENQAGGWRIAAVAACADVAAGVLS